MLKGGVQWYLLNCRRTLRLAYVSKYPHPASFPKINPQYQPLYPSKYISPFYVLLRKSQKALSTVITESPERRVIA